MKCRDCIFAKTHLPMNRKYVCGLGVTDQFLSSTYDGCKLTYQEAHERRDEIERDKKKRFNESMKEREAEANKSLMESAIRYACLMLDGVFAIRGDDGKLIEVTANDGHVMGLFASYLVDQYQQGYWSLQKSLCEGCANRNRPQKCFRCRRYGLLKDNYEKESTVQEETAPKDTVREVSEKEMREWEEW